MLRVHSHRIVWSWLSFRLKYKRPLQIFILKKGTSVNRVDRLCVPVLSADRIAAQIWATVTSAVDYSTSVTELSQFPSLRAVSLGAEPRQACT